MALPYDELTARLQAGLPERYTLEREIGRGGMAVVYLARERHPSRQVAIKVLDPIVTVGIGRERFLREIDFVSKLTHPHIVPVFAAGNASDLLYFVMPFVEGESLAERIRREGRLQTATALRLASEIAQALEYAHRRGIVHRDIKPENILLHDDFALVADFGVARAIRAARDDEVTQEGFTLGTPAYMSPEQAAGAAEVGPRADVYALGCVLYHMLAGTPPFGQGPWDRIMQQQIQATAPSLADRVPGLPAPVVDVVMRALAKAPDNRHPSAGAFAEAIEGRRASLVSAERQALGPPQGTRWSVVTRVATAAIAIAALGVVLLGRREAAPDILAAGSVAYAESLAVMPIENLTDEPALERMADAVTYEVIASLHRVPDLKLPAYASVRRLADAPLAPREIVEQLGVRLVLSSQLRQVGQDVRLDAELVDGRTNRVVEGGSWSIGPAGGRNLEASLVRRLVEVVAEGAGLATRPDRLAGLEGPAYEPYLLGKHWLTRRTPQGIRHAIEYFRQALAVDSTYAPAHEGLSSANMLALFYRYEIGRRGYETAALALSAADRAVALDPLNALAYAARGYVVSRAYGPTGRAARDFRRALDLSPNSGQAVAWSGAVYAWQGDSVRAMEATLRGAELDPLSPAAQLVVAMAALPTGDYDRAAAAAHRATELEPELVESRAVEGRALLLAGRLDECLRIAFGPHEAIRALCLHAAGRPIEARAIVDSIAGAVTSGSLHDTAYTDVVRADGLASYYAWTGDRVAAVRWLQYAFDRSPMGVDRRVLDSDLFDSLRADPVTAEQMKAMTARIWTRVERTRPPR